MLWIILALLTAYLLGSIPTALWVGRAFFNLRDIREHGSGNAGATNTFRVLGKKAGSFVLLTDAFKGFAAAYFLPNFLLSQGLIAPENLFYYRLVCGVLAVVGHIYPVFAQFRGQGGSHYSGHDAGHRAGHGGRGAAGISGGAGHHALRVAQQHDGRRGLRFLAAPTPFRPANPLQVWFGFLLAAMLIYTHRANISRLRAGTESRVPLWGKR